MTPLRDQFSNWGNEDDDQNLNVQSTVANAFEFALREQLMDASAILHLDNRCLIDSAVHLFQQLRGDCQRLQAPAQRGKLALALWEALNRQGSPRAPQDIAFICGVEPRRMLLLEKESAHLMQPTYCPPSSYVATICAVLDLPYQVARIIEEVVTKIQDRHLGRKPESVVGAVLMAVCNNANHVEASHIDVKYLCDILQVTPVSLRTIGRLLPADVIELAVASLQEITI